MEIISNIRLELLDEGTNATNTMINPLVVQSQDYFGSDFCRQPVTRVVVPEDSVLTMKQKITKSTHQNIVQFFAPVPADHSIVEVGQWVRAYLDPKEQMLEVPMKFCETC